MRERERDLELDEELGSDVVGRVEQGVEGGSKAFEFGVKKRVGGGRQGWNLLPFEIFAVVVGDARLLPYEGDEARVYACLFEFHFDFSGVED